MKIENFYRGASEDLIYNVTFRLKEGGVDYQKIWKSGRGESLTEIGVAVLEFKHALMDQLFILDYTFVWFANLATVYTIKIIGDDNSSPRERVTSMLLWRVSTDLSALRVLVLTGHDIQAKQLVRSVIENLEALGLASFEPNFCTDFVAKQDADVSHEVWFKYIAKKRARRAIEAYLMTEVGVDVSDDDYHLEQDRILTAAAHPSFVTGLASVFPSLGFKTEEDPIGPSGTPSPHSVRTLNYANYHLLRYLVHDLAAFKSVEAVTVFAEKFDDAPDHADEVLFLAKAREVALILATYQINFASRYAPDAFGQTDDEEAA